MALRSREISELVALFSQTVHPKGTLCISHLNIKIHVKELTISEVFLAAVNCEAIPGICNSGQPVIFGQIGETKSACLLLSLIIMIES